MLLLDRFHVSYFAYGTALINALAIAKVILIGEAVHAGTKFEKKALLYSAIWKALVFGLLVFAFHLLEEMITHLVHGKGSAGALHNIHRRPARSHGHHLLHFHSALRLSGTPTPDGPGRNSGSLFPFSIAHEIHFERPLKVNSSCIRKSRPAGFARTKPQAGF